MLVIKTCECGSTEFEKEDDDDVLRCSNCNKLAKFINVEVSKEEENND